MGVTLILIILKYFIYKPFQHVLKCLTLIFKTYIDEAHNNGRNVCKIKLKRSFFIINEAQIGRNAYRVGQICYFLNIVFISVFNAEKNYYPRKWINFYRKDVAREKS